MKPRRTEYTNMALELPGGNEDNTLFVHATVEETTRTPVMVSTWELTPEEQEAVAAGERVCLVVHGTVHQPVALMLERELYAQAVEQPEAPRP